MWNVRFLAGKYVTSSSNIQYPDHLLPSGQGGKNPSATVSDRWSGYGNARDVVRLKGGDVGAKS